ncbi:hypothetical protein Dsin_023001 [Dipteronia sinensis]|uniref:RNase H type-1 domain-containing protein n=1 Tax=Dipteronia sinensis TaxID=43782 RepID=A0AAE0E0G3_9ROSI|nr:hypothetical protein Dsin_023001 [Dipteronia sinensis]
MDTLKFNVDGSSRGKPGPSGIGGVLRDSNGKVLCLYSYYMGILDSNVAELLAIKRAVELCFSNIELKSHDIVVTVYDIRGMLKDANGIKVAFDSRIFNSFADSLAKMRSSISGDFVEWGDI